jgi:hypothetical protein
MKRSSNATSRSFARRIRLLVSALALISRTDAEAVATEPGRGAVVAPNAANNDNVALDQAQLDAIAGIVHEQLVAQLSDFHHAYQQLAADFRQLSSTFHVYQEQHRNDLETLEKRLRDDYAQDMGGMELWMRQEHGRAIAELKNEHHGALVLLREELMDHVQQHADRVTELDCKVQEGMAIWSSVVDATLQVTGGTSSNKSNPTNANRESADADASRSRSEAMEDLPKDASWFASKQRLRSGSSAQ